VSASQQEILEALRQGGRFLVCSHVNPDGDAVGSVLACEALLRALGKDDITLALHDAVPTRYAWLPGATAIKGPGDLADGFDTVVILDVANVKRVGAVAEAFPADARVVVIDHHLVDEPCGHVNHIDPTAAATGEIMTELIAQVGAAQNGGMDPDCATNAYVAIATDTGGFRFSNTTERTHRAAAACVRAGVDVAGVSTRLFDVIAPAKFRLMAKLLSRTQFEVDGRLAYTEVTETDLVELGASGQDLDGIINLPRSVEGVDVAMMLRAMPNGDTKVSVRAREGFNASEFCKEFGGGGHAAAAGVTIEAGLHDVKTRVIARAREWMGAEV